MTGLFRSGLHFNERFKLVFFFFLQNVHCVYVYVCVLLQHMYALWGGGLVEASHVLVHLREALLHVILSAALPHSPKTEAQGWMVQLRK